MSEKTINALAREARRIMADVEDLRDRISDVQEEIEGLRKEIEGSKKKERKGILDEIRDDD